LLCAILPGTVRLAVTRVRQKKILENMYSLSRLYG
jgi:hypothetical protein